ncbi:MAG: hypothetical protein ABIJ56_15470 [Pseudomonadota bacterium]
MPRKPMLAVLGAMLVLLTFCSGGNGSSDDADADAEEAMDLSTEEAVEDVGEEEPEEDVEDDAADMVEEEVSSALALALGEVEEIDTIEEGVFDVEIAAPEGGEQYALILFATDWVRGATYDFTSSLSGTGGGGRGSADRPESLPNVEHPLMPHGRAPVDWAAVYHWLGSNPIPKWDELPDDPLPEVDEVREFSITDGSDHVQTIDAQCQFVDEEIAIWFDITSEPETVVEELDEIGSLFAGMVMPRERVFFGDESDYNGDGVLHVLFSPFVAESATAYFYPCDLFENPGEVAGCRYGNRAEMLYVSPPNLLDEHMRSAMAIVETMAHETAHMIYFHRKFLLNDQPMAMENIYLNEGLAALAQDLTGMAAGNFFVMQAGLAQIETFRAIDILYNMGGYIPDRDGGLRGQAYLFLRYLYDQAGGEEVQSDGSFIDSGGIAWLNAYVDDAERGQELIEAMMGDRAIEETVFDFYTALVLSNRGPDGAPISDNPAYNYLPTRVDPLTERTRGADMFENFRGMFQLEGPANGFIDFNDGTIYSTGVQYLFFDAGEPGTLQVHVEIDAAAAARMRVARVK